MTQKKTILLRLDPKLWKELQSWSKTEIRSLNKLMEYILHEAVSKMKEENK